MTGHYQRESDFARGSIARPRRGRRVRRLAQPSFAVAAGRLAVLGDRRVLLVRLLAHRRGELTRKLERRLAPNCTSPLRFSRAIISMSPRSQLLEIQASETS